MWDFGITVHRVVDSDTADFLVDVGFYLTSVQRFRFLNCDGPERHEAGWAECTAFTKDWLATHPNLRAATTKTDDFGRWLADIYSGDQHLSDGLNTLMAANGWTSPGRHLNT